MQLLYIALGGALGTLARYGTALGVARATTLPLATLLVNAVGCFILAATAEGAARAGGMPETVRLALTVGFCGGLTTYSTFNQEALGMLRGPAAWTAALYVVTTGVLCGVAGLGGTLAGARLAAAATAVR